MFDHSILLSYMHKHILTICHIMILYHCHLHTCTLDAHPSRCADVYKLANTKPITKFDFCTCTNMYLNLHSISSSSRSNMMVIHAHFTFAETTNIPFTNACSNIKFYFRTCMNLVFFYRHPLTCTPSRCTKNVDLPTYTKSITKFYFCSRMNMYLCLDYIYSSSTRSSSIIKFDFCTYTNIYRHVDFFILFIPLHSLCSSFTMVKQVYLLTCTKSIINFYFCTCTKMYLLLHFNLYHSD